MNQASAVQTLSIVPKIWILNHKLNRYETGFSKTTTRTSFIIKTGLIRKNHRILSQSINPMVTTNLNPREKSSKTLTCTQKRSLRTDRIEEVQLFQRISELKNTIRTRQQRKLHTWTLHTRTNYIRIRHQISKLQTSSQTLVMTAQEEFQQDLRVSTKLSESRYLRHTSMWLNLKCSDFWISFQCRPIFLMGFRIHRRRYSALGTQDFNLTRFWIPRSLDSQFFKNFRFSKNFPFFFYFWSRNLIRNNFFF